MKIAKEDILSLISDIIGGLTGNSSPTISDVDGADTIEGWDSLVTVAIATALSDEYGLEVEVDELDKFSSVAAIFDMLELK